jgi:DNA-binding CsgD family transcriptional regulator
VKKVLPLPSLHHNVFSPSSKANLVEIIHQLHTLKTAAAKLDVAFSTTETYRKRAYAKLGIASKAAWSRFVKRQGSALLTRASLLNDKQYRPIFVSFETKLIRVKIVLRSAVDTGVIVNNT